uniref:Uncharacterized protein n=1 Tax=Acrobeloides nanus TaxID=290746 RepID=A0A914EJD2_9BILA
MRKMSIFASKTQFFPESKAEGRLAYPLHYGNVIKSDHLRLQKWNYVPYAQMKVMDTILEPKFVEHAVHFLEEAYLREKCTNVDSLITVCLKMISA